MPLRLIALFAVVLPIVVQAQSAYPDRQITLVSGFPPGGPADVIPRMITPKLSSLLGVQVIVENKPGAQGNIAASYVVSSKPDGYTLFAMSGGTMTTNQWLYSKLPFDPLKAFIPISVIGASPNVLVVNSSVDVSDVKGLIDLIKAKPGQLNYGTPGIGSSPYLSGELFKIEAGGLDLVHVPYRGGSEALKDLLAGRLQVGLSTPSLFLPYIQSGKLKALAVTSKVRSPLLPDVPTMEEAGLAGYEVLGWYGIAAPAGTPEPVVERLYGAIQQALKDDEFTASLAKLGFTVASKSPAETTHDIAQEAAKWRGVIRKLNIQLD